MTVSQNRRLLTLAIGLVTGALVTHLVHLIVHPFTNKPVSSEHRPMAVGAANLNTENRHKTGATSSPLCPTVGQMRDINIADELFNKVRILCLIITHPENYATKAVAVNNTWARRCNQYAFFGSRRTKLNIPLLYINIKETRNNLWKKTWMSIDYAADHFNLNDFDFVLKADDDTFIVMENLRYLLLPLDPDESSLIGRIFEPSDEPLGRYTSGGAGYLLSQRAAKTFVRKVLRNRDRGADLCDLQSGMPEDFKLGQCLLKLGARLVDTRDNNGLERFHPVSLGITLGLIRTPAWLLDYNYYKSSNCSTNCASPVSVSTHYATPADMYKFEFLLYRLRPIGIDPVALHAKVAVEMLNIGEIRRKLK